MDIAAYIAENEALRAENARLREQLGVLQHELAQLKRLIFGAHSERFEPAQAPGTLSLFGEAPAEEPAPVVNETLTRTRPKSKPVRQGLPAHLPREVIVIEPEGDVSGLKKIGEEITETLDYRPGKLVVIRRVLPKYADPRHEAAGVVIGNLPVRPIDKGIAEPSLLAHVLIEKYADSDRDRSGTDLPSGAALQAGRHRAATHHHRRLGGGVGQSARSALRGARAADQG
jgi:hypothetical protein